MSDLIGLTSKRSKEIIALGLPIGLTNFLEIGVFSLMALLIGRLGTSSIAAHQIAIIIAALAFMVALAIGQGTTIRVGFSVGARHLAQAKETAIVAISGTLCLSLVSAAVLFLSAERVVALFTEDAAVFALGVELLRLAAAFQLVDFAQVVAIGALRGYKATTFPMVANFIGYWMLALPIGYLLSHGSGVVRGRRGARLLVQPDPWAGGGGSHDRHAALVAGAPSGADPEAG